MLLTIHSFLFPVFVNPLLSSCLDVGFIMLVKHIEAPFDRIVVALVFI